jgi:hypothetical protein
MTDANRTTLPSFLDLTYFAPKQSAQARWQSIILAEAPNINAPTLDLTGGRIPGYNYTGFVDDIIIFYQLATLPTNVLGSAGPVFIRLPSAQPISGIMTFSSEFFAQNRITENVVLHEMAHALGLGTVSAGERGSRD